MSTQTLSTETTIAQPTLVQPGTPDASVVIVSFNTRDLLARCLRTLLAELEGISSEVFVVDNASSDGSPDMVESEFPSVRLIRSPVNRGFGAANNIALRLATGRYAILLNSDAFPEPDAFRRAIAHMDANPNVALGGARLIGRDGGWQPSGRLFPSLLNDFLTLSGLSARFPYSPFFGRADRTWADVNRSAEVDWVPGAFSIIRRSALERVGLFDEAFFFYYEEVDLCVRLKQSGYKVWYYADVVVVHLGGESSKKVTSQQFSESGAQLAAWRMRSAFLYYRKHHGMLARAAKELERLWYFGRVLKNRLQYSSPSGAKAMESARAIRLLEKAWLETSGGAVSPERPW
jgi:GT2 family glycosyltransferase